jgi:outer membrane protein assembly factor BamB
MLSRTVQVISICILFISFFQYIVISQSSIPVDELSVASPDSALQEFSILWRYGAVGGVRTVCIDAEGRYITAGGKGFITYLDTETGESIWSFEKSYQVNTLLAKDDGSLIIAGVEQARLFVLKEDGSVHWNPKTKGPVLALAMTKSGRDVVFGTFFGSLYFADPMSKEVFSVYQREGSAVIQLAISDVSSMVAAGYSDDSIEAFQWEVSDPLWHMDIEGHAMTMEYSPEGDMLLVGSNKGILYALDPEKGTVLWKFQTNATISALAFIEDASKVAVGSHDNHVYLLNLSDGSQVWTFQSEGAIKSLEYMKRSMILGVGSNDRELRLLNITSGTELASVEAGSWITTISSSNDESIIAFGAGKVVHCAKIRYNEEKLQEISMNTSEREQGRSFVNPMIAVAIVIVVGVGGYVLLKRYKLSRRITS